MESFRPVFFSWLTWISEGIAPVFGVELVFEKIHWEFSEAEPKNSEAAQKLHDLPKYFPTFVFFFTANRSPHKQAGLPHLKSPYVSGHEKKKKITLQKFFSFGISKMAPYFSSRSIPPFLQGPSIFGGPKTAVSWLPRQLAGACSLGDPTNVWGTGGSSRDPRDPTEPFNLWDLWDFLQHPLITNHNNLGNL